MEPVDGLNHVQPTAAAHFAMKIQLLSDLHLERDPRFQPRAAEDADVLVLAGDIGSYQVGSRLCDDDFGLTRFSPLAPNAPWRRVLFTPGNHEFDELDFDTTTQRLQALCAALGIEWLERNTIQIGRVRFVGTTLWSDFDALAQQESSLTQQLQAREKAYRAANFYLSKHTTQVLGAPLLANAMRDLSLQCQAWLRGVLQTPFDGTTVVVTHFAPSLRSADPRYGRNASTAGFCNGLDALRPYAHTWMHGHLHCANDYQVRGTADGRDFCCRVVANPLGYLHKGEQAGFHPTFVVEVPS